MYDRIVHNRYIYDHSSKNAVFGTFYIVHGLEGNITKRFPEFQQFAFSPNTKKRAVTTASQRKQAVFLFQFEASRRVHMAVILTITGC